MILKFNKNNENKGTGLARPVTVNLTSDVFLNDVPQKIDHAAEPIKDINNIIKIQEYLVSTGRYRDNLLFTMGINIGLRCVDLLEIKVGNLVNSDGTGFLDKTVVREQKTQKLRTIYWNDAVYDAAELYFDHIGECSLNDYLFRCEGNRGKNSGKPMNVSSVERILKEVINDKLHLDIRASTHCLRKTFAYHMICSAPDRSRAIEFLQKILGHSRPSITLRYAGITDDEIETAYKQLNLGSRNPFGWEHVTRVS